LTPSEIADVLERACVPEHSAGFMQAMSGGEPFLVGDYLFFAAESWLIAVGYPLDGGGRPRDFDQSLREAVRRTRARECWAIAPVLPGPLRAHRHQKDGYFVRPSGPAPPARLERLAGRAAARLRVEEGRVFTPSHRRLWSEFMARAALPDHVSELYARTEAVLEKTPALRLLNAWDDEGRLSACLLLDLAPRRFLSYLVGAHSRRHATPHASDLLFSEMIRLARREGKEYLHLGLGVNPGIRRFKTKWGAAAGPAYEMARWREPEGLRDGVSAFMRHMASMPREPLSKREYLDRLPRQRRLAMLWEIEKAGRRSWIAGTAHFFCYSFELSLRHLLEKVDTVIFEGPLDRASLDQVAAAGRRPDPQGPALIEVMSPEEVSRLERTVCGPRGFWARFFGRELRDPPDVRFFLSKTRPWMAFFSIWTRYLACRGWTQSVDLEAWELAVEMGKSVHGMETIAEQIETLESIPVSRIVSFFRGCAHWSRYMQRNMKAYLKGDLEAMMGTSIEFPSRTERVIGRRDARFLERMRPFIEAGGSAVFVGTAHMLELRGMLAREGFRLRRCR
jgi:uncharacterized protein YbaP (TraB family)